MATVSTQKRSKTYKNACSLIITDHAKEIILCIASGSYFKKLVEMTTTVDNSEVCYNCAGTIGQISTLGRPTQKFYLIYAY